MLSIVAALAALAIPTVPVTVHYGPCPDARDALGCYYTATQTMWVDEPDNHATYWHEMGHAVDRQRLDDGERNAFKCLPAMRVDLGVDRSACGLPWAGDNEEAFADAYANCKLRWRPSRGDFLLDPYEPSTDRRHLNACRFITRAASD